MSKPQSVRDVLNVVVHGYQGADLDELSRRVLEAWIDAGVVEDAALYAARSMVREQWSGERRSLLRVASSSTGGTVSERLATVVSSVTFDTSRPKTRHVEVNWVVEVRQSKVHVPGESFVMLNDMDADMLDKVAAARRDLAARVNVYGDAFAALAAKVRTAGVERVADLSDAEIEADLTVVARGLPRASTA